MNLSQPALFSQALVRADSCPDFQDACLSETGISAGSVAGGLLRLHRDANAKGWRSTDYFRIGNFLLECGRAESAKIWFSAGLRLEEFR